MIDGVLGLRNRYGSRLGDGPGHFTTFSEQDAPFVEPVDEPDLERLFRSDLPTRKYQFFRHARPHEPGESLRTSRAGDDRQMGLCESQGSARRGDPDITGQRKFRSSAQRHTVDGRNDGLIK